MGIRGLTTFIQNRSHLYLDEYELHDTSIVIDGYAIACQLYKWHCKCNDCFGGDYDKYAAVIELFFQQLSLCNVVPYVVFDGGYETRKVATVISRMKNKIKSAKQLNNVTEGSISVFPLFLGDIFEDIVLKLNIKCVRCDFEGDTETANVARTLNCPVLSYDSDFFIFDVLYIPFSTFEMCTRKKKKTQCNKFYTYISCKIYRVEKFLKSFGGLDKSNLPILAVLLGNDYVKSSVFTTFFKQLKIQKCHGNQNEQQKRIKSLIIWLQNESVESAVQKVLSRYKCRNRKLVAEKIHNAIKGYHCTSSTYLQYLQITPVQPKDPVQICLDLNFINDENTNENLESSEDGISDSEEVISSNYDNDLYLDKNKLDSDVPTIFFEKFRKCLYPPSFMDILMQNKYYCIPQVENDSLEYSHAISSEILSAIQKILRNSEDNLVCVARSNNGHIKSHLLSSCDINLPSLWEIPNISLTARKHLFLQVLKIDNHFMDCLNLYPQSWNLYIIAIKYLLDKSAITWSVLYALVLCKIFLDYVDKHVGMCRSKKVFEKKICKLSIPVANKEETKNADKVTIKDALEDINHNDSLTCLKTLFCYFHVDFKMKMKNHLFDRNILHSMAQFQSCLLHLKYLNILLDSPFANFIISDIFNGTFVYNLSQTFMKRSNLDNYIALILQDSPTILNSFKLIVKNIQEHCENNIVYDNPPLRRKKKNKRKEVDVIYSDCTEQNPSPEETVFDPNNKYSLLIYAEGLE